MARIWGPRETPRREASPPLWQLFCTEWLLLSRQDSARWWRALDAATWSRPTALRGIVVCRAALGPAQGSMRHFVRENLSPHALVNALEDLIQEGLLPPGMARAIEEAVLRKTHMSGLWL